MIDIFYNANNSNKIVNRNHLILWTILLLIQKLHRQLSTVLKFRFCSIFEPELFAQLATHSIQWKVWYSSWFQFFCRQILLSFCTTNQLPTHFSWLNVLYLLYIQINIRDKTYRIKHGRQNHFTSTYKV